MSSNFSRQSMYSYGKMPLRVNKSKFSADNLKNSRCIIRSLSLLRYDVNLSKFEMRNLYESMKRNFMLFFFRSSSVLLTFFVNEIYFSFVIGSSSTHPYCSYFLGNKMRNHSQINYGKLRECNANLNLIH